MLWTAPPQHYPEMTGIFGLTRTAFPGSFTQKPAHSGVGRAPRPAERTRQARPFLRPAAGASPRGFALGANRTRRSGGNDVNDAVDGAHSTASMCQRVVALSEPL